MYIYYTHVITFVCNGNIIYLFYVFEFYMIQIQINACVLTFHDHKFKTQLLITNFSICNEHSRVAERLRMGC